MRTLKEAALRTALGALPLIVAMALWPAQPAHAGLFDVFTSLFGTANKIGDQASQLSSYATKAQDMQQKVLCPIEKVNQYRSFVTTIANSYRPWMSQVMHLPLQSATLPSTQTWESLLRTGKNTAPTSLRLQFNSIYGSSLPTNSAPQLIQQMTDMNDATALTTTSLATGVDESSEDLLDMAADLEDQSSNTAPGTAEMVQAQALALQLQSLAMQHQLLAAELRAEAAALASQGAELKTSADHASTMNGVLNSLPKAKVVQ